MSWQDYFEYTTETINGKTVEYYEYKDKSVIALPSNLPMPPTDTLHSMFRDCKQLQDITALANWDVSKVKNICSMFIHCHQLNDITALTNWNVSSIKNTSYMFYGCH